MIKLIILLVGIIIATLGIVCIFDARIITRKLFGFGDQNEGTMGLKIFGFLFAISGGLVIFFNI